MAIVRPGIKDIVEFRLESNSVSASKTEISGHAPEGVNGHDAAPTPDGDPRDCGPMPECLIRRVPLDRRPALGPPGDSLDDLR